MAENTNDLMEKLVALCKRRGFIFQSSEIYGGINGFWDYGPLGVELKRNIKEAWWQDIVRDRDDMVGLDCSIIMNPKVWEASGHLAGFSDPMVECKSCHGRYRQDMLSRWALYEFPEKPDTTDPFKITDHGSKQPAFSYVTEVGADLDASRVVVRRITGDKRAKLSVVQDSRDPGQAHLWAEVNGKQYAVLQWMYTGKVAEGEPCPNCGSPLMAARQFNLMLPTSIGAMEDTSSRAYLRPETAQGIFCNYKNVLDTTRLKLPFGIAQVGKSFRNEINPRNYTFRSREFEQMEIEFFCHPKEADTWYEYWRDARYKWYVGLGLVSSKLRLRPHEKDELAHYARACADIEYSFPFGISELEGVANRTDFDLKAHQDKSGKDMQYFDDETKERFIPYVIEPSGGVDRAALAFLCEAYCEDTAPDENGKPQARTVMKFHPRLAPIKVAVFPLVKKEGMPEIAAKIHAECKKAGLASFYDEKGAVGRRYRRQDEAGTPFCVTVDGQTLQDQSVTVRDRDSLKQDRIAAESVPQYVRDRIGQ